MTPVRCRFAPAPSGSLHVGNVRSALFSWLYARRHGGTFILRVEDTDASRVTEEAVNGVLGDLRWLGLDWDEGPEVGGDAGPYRQSQRLDIYREHAARLIEAGDAYRCYCTSPELEERRAAAMKRGEAPGYDGRCRDLSSDEREGFEAEGRSSVVRFRMPDREWVVDDLVKGEVRFAPGQLRDFVLLRSDGSPVFLLAVAVDDLLMGVTHVVRGDDLLASAPRNAAVIEALGGTPPRYAHVPQVLGPDRQPLSKRHGSTSVVAFREQGYLPEALVNYLALLGWSAEDEREFLSRDELVERFDLARVSSNPAAFDVEKLTWMNNRYIQSLDDDELGARCLHFLTEAGLTPDVATLRAAMPIVKERMKTLAESVDLLRFLFTDDIELNDKAAAIVAKAPEGYLGRAASALETVEWDAASIQAVAGRPRGDGGPQSHQGVPAGSGRDHGLERIAALARVAGAAGAGPDPLATPRGRLAGSPVLDLVPSQPHQARPQGRAAGDLRCPRRAAPGDREDPCRRDLAAMPGPLHAQPALHRAQGSPGHRGRGRALGVLRTRSRLGDDPAARGLTDARARSSPRPPSCSRTPPRTCSPTCTSLASTDAGFTPRTRSSACTRRSSAAPAWSASSRRWTR